MNTVQRIAKNTITLLISQAVVSIFGLILSILIARKLGDIQYGKYAFAVAFTGIFCTFVGLGYGMLMIREVARDKSLIRKYFGNVTAIYLVTSIVTNVILIITINLLHYPTETKLLVYSLGIYTGLVAIASIARMTFRIYERMEYEMYTLILREAVRVGLGIAILLMGYGLKGLAYVFVFSGIVDLLISFFICSKKFTKPRIEFDFSFLTSTLKIAFPFALFSVFALIYTNTDTVIISVLKGDEAVGLYNVANNLTQNLQPFAVLFLNALFPIISIYYLSSKESLKIAYEKAFQYLFIISLPMSVGIFILAQRIILLVYGSGYEKSVVVLQILSFEILLMFMIQCLGFMLVAINKQNEMVLIICIGALVNVVCNVILIPHFSYIGSAIATIITEIILFYFYYYQISKYLKKLSLLKLTVSPIIATILMTIFIYCFKGINLILLIIIAVAIYFFAIYFTRGISQEDIGLLKQIFKIPKNNNPD